MKEGCLFRLKKANTTSIAEMSNFGWDLEKYEKKNQIAIVDASPLRQISKEEINRQSQTKIRIKKCELEGLSFRFKR